MFQIGGAFDTISALCRIYRRAIAVVQQAITEFRTSKWVICSKFVITRCYVQINQSTLGIGQINCRKRLSGSKSLICCKFEIMCGSLHINRNTIPIPQRNPGIELNSSNSLICRKFAAMRRFL
jgi:hypothetical protein